MERNWQDAKEVCEFFGAKLSLIDTQEKNDAIKGKFSKIPFLIFSIFPALITQTMAKNQFEGFWIDAKTRAEMKSNSTSNYSNFSEDLVLDGCALVDQTGKWKIRSCTQKHFFICQLNKNW